MTKITTQEINTNENNITIDTTNIPSGSHNIKARFIPGNNSLLGQSESTNKELNITLETTTIQYTYNEFNTSLLISLHDSNGNQITDEQTLQKIKVHEDKNKTGTLTTIINNEKKVQLFGITSAEEANGFYIEFEGYGRYAPSNIIVSTNNTEIVEIDTTDLTQFITWAGDNTYTNANIDGYISTTDDYATTCKQPLQRDMTIHAEFDATSSQTVSGTRIGLLQRQRQGISEYMNYFKEENYPNVFDESHNGTRNTLGTAPPHTEKIVIDVIIDENGYITYTNELGNTYISNQAFTDDELETMEFGWAELVGIYHLYLKKLVYTYTQ